MARHGVGNAGCRGCLCALAALMVLLGACEDNGSSEVVQNSGGPSGAAGMEEAPPSPPSPPAVDMTPVVEPPAAGAPSYENFMTGEIDIPAGKERYLCHTMTLTEDVNIDRFEYDVQPGVHHFLLARTMKPEQEGTFECNVLFRLSWIPVFGAGNGSQVLQLPEGAAQVLPAGTQLLIQLHLLNSGTEDLRQDVGIRMRKSDLPDPKPVGIYAFGTDRVEIPAAGASSVTNDCAVPKDVTLFAALPHMHYLGQSLVFELQDAATGQFKEVYRREPWDFDAQFVEPMPLEIPKGTMTRVTCNYQNDTENVVQFGESSNDEMCFLVAYQVGGTGLNGCVEFDPANF